MKLFWDKFKQCILVQSTILYFQGNVADNMNFAIHYVWAKLKTCNVKLFEVRPNLKNFFLIVKTISLTFSKNNT